VNLERYQRSLDYYLTYAESVRAVTLEDIQAVAREFIQPDRSVTVAAGTF